MKDERGAVYLAFRKVWTDRAAGSSRADYRSPTRVLYHNKTALQTPDFPTQLDLGPEPVCRGVNLEADKDQSGVYRYSVVRIFFDTAYSLEMLTARATGESARSEAIARAVAALNRFIDVYRLVTNEAHIQRVASVHVRDLYFREHNLGFHAASFGHGIGTAIMNRSGRELTEISRLMDVGEDITPWNLLFLDAQAALDNNGFTLAIVSAFQALELRLEDFLEGRMALQGIPAEQIEEQLNRNWRTKDRLRELVPALTGRRLMTDDQALWDRFCWAYDDIRNKLIHAARELDKARTGIAVTACRDVSRWLDSIV